MDKIKVSFPLRGVWQVVTSPADHVPSHYTHRLGMTYAFDFAKSADVEISFLSRLTGVPIERSEGWKELVYSPCDGEIVAACNTVNDRRSLNLFADIFSGLKALIYGSRCRDYQRIFGNYMIIKAESYYCLLAHLQQGSIKASVGEPVLTGDCLARIGHCGSSRAPHLHIQLMDNADLGVSKGLPISFDLKVNQEGRWQTIRKYVPGRGTDIQRLDPVI